MSDQLLMAEQQLFGYHSAGQGERIPALVRGMGLGESEWMLLQQNGMVDYLTDSEKLEIDECFKDK